jgi:NAD(P)H-quinone oxidoreductase subunit K
MPDPKYVIAMGACMITGGMFSMDSPTAIRGADKILPVDVYIPGCPPRPEAIIDGLIKLRKKISMESLQERGIKGPTHRFYSTRHNMKPAPAIYTGEYLVSPDRQKPPAVITEAMGTEMPPALLTQPDRDAERARINPRLDAKLDASQRRDDQKSSDVGA